MITIKRITYPLGFLAVIIYVASIYYVAQPESIESAEKEMLFKPPVRVTGVVRETVEEGADEGVGKNIEVEDEIEEWEAEHLTVVVEETLGSAAVPNAGGNSGANATRAANLTNEVVVQPGEVYSFNQTVGARTTSRGFSPGETIVKGEDGHEVGLTVGGGICRTSTTIHHAVLNAGLQAIERHNHSLPVSYAEPGLDAAVAYGYLDYKFKNTTEYPIKLKTYIEDGNIIAKLIIIKEVVPSW